MTDGIIYKRIKAAAYLLLFVISFISAEFNSLSNSNI